MSCTASFHQGAVDDTTDITIPSGFFHYEDAQRIMNALITAEDNEELGSCNRLVFDTWTPIGPDGGYVGGEQRVRVALSTGL